MKKVLMTGLKIIVFFSAWVMLISMTDTDFSNPVLWRFFAELIPLVMIVVLTFLFLKIEKKTVRIPIKDNIGKGMVVGIIVGFLWICVPAYLLFTLKQLLITNINEIPYIWIWIVSAFMNVVMQELLVRGYIYQLLKVKHNLSMAVIITTLLFTLLHGGAIGAGVIPVINVITMCLFTTVLYESEGTLMAPIFAHAIWNIFGAIVIGGVNLAEDYPSIMDLSVSVNNIISGGNCKIEGSIIVTIMNLMLSAVFYNKYRKDIAVKNTTEEQII